MSDKKTLEEMEAELEDMQASECRRVAVREQEHQRQLAVLRRRARIVAVFVVLGAVAVFLMLLASLSSAPSMPPPVEEPPESWATDTMDGGVIERDMPKDAFKGQKKPPCKRRTQVELVGACWVLSGVAPPCEDLFDHQGRCYVPVMEAQRPPTSIEP